VLLVRIRIHIKSFLKHKFLILDTHHPDDSIKNVRIHCYFSKPKSLRAKNFGKHWSKEPFTFLTYLSVFFAVPIFVLCALYLVKMSVFVFSCRCIYAYAGERNALTLQASLRRTFHFCVQSKKKYYSTLKFEEAFFPSVHMYQSVRQYISEEVWTYDQLQNKQWPASSICLA
jgi:hypothetical protein